MPINKRYWAVQILNNEAQLNLLSSLKPISLRIALWLIYYCLYISDILSSVLQLKVIALRCISCKSPMRREDLQKADIFLLENLSEFKEEVANCSKFAELLSSEVDILVNDSFCQSHKVLASTVGVARFCYASMAGFSFEENLHQLKKIAKTKKKPYLAVVWFFFFFPQ